MATPIGLVGGLAVGAEAVTYGTEAASYTWLHGGGSTLGLRRGTIIRPSRVQATAYTEGAYATPFVDGEISGDWTFEGDTMLVLLRALGDDTAGTVVINGGTIDTASISVEVVYGSALSYKAFGCVATGLRIEGQPNAPVRWTVPLIGQTWSKDATPGTVTLPAESQVAYPADVGALSIGGTAVLYDSFSLSVDIPYEGTGRAAYGATTIRQPIRSGPAKITGSIQVILNDATGDNTIAELDDYIAGTALGAITFGATKFQLADCRMIGEPPAWTGGPTTFPINFEAESLTIVTS